MTSISVIVPACNEEHFLPRSLSSLRHSGLALADACPAAEWELIVVDNSSTDATVTVARSYGATVVSEPDRNVARARNRGAAAAHGELLAFVDADYRVPLRFLPAVASHFRGTADLAAAGVRVVLEPSEIDPITRHTTRALLGGLRRIRNMSFGVFLFRRDYFISLSGFDDAAFAYEDVEMLNRIRQDQRTGRAQYQIFGDVTVYASARGFYRPRMVRTYAVMALSARARRDPARCGYWYDR